MPPAPSPPISASAARASRLLEALHPVCSHDLPNQIVALQSLLQLFSWDEAQHLTPQGQEYFDRLNSIAGKAAAFVQYLKELVRLQRQTPLCEKTSVPQFVEEFRAEVQRLFPEKAGTWHCCWQIDSIDVDRRLLQNGLVHLLRSVVDDEIGAFTMVMATAPQPDGVSWTITVQAQAGAGAAPARSDAAQIRQRLALTLAQHYLAATDIACRPVEGAAAGATSFALEIPKRTPHG